MTDEIQWNIPFKRNVVPVASELVVLERMNPERMRSEELGAYIRLVGAEHHSRLVRATNSDRCMEAEAFFAFCAKAITQVEDDPSLELIAAAKLCITDRFVHVMGVLPPSHYLTVLGYSYPFHACVPEIFYEAHAQLSRMAVTAHSQSDFEGLLLGYKYRFG